MPHPLCSPPPRLPPPPRNLPSPLFVPAPPAGAQRRFRAGTRVFKIPPPAPSRGASRRATEGALERATARWGKRGVTRHEVLDAP
jgi:hypothetical protein